MTKPTHLEPSKLGTREYWDALYTTEIANHAHDPSDIGTIWFDDSDASEKVLEYLSSPELDLDMETTSFLDLGTGNGALLFALRDEGWKGPMLGVDYSARSVEFARRIERGRREDEEGEEGKEGEVDVHFAEHDILKSPSSPLLSATYSPAVTAGWDVLLDKGTFDAVSLSAETLDTTNNGEESTGNEIGNAERRINEAYGTRILPLIRENGLFLITSCNWVEAELKSWFEDEKYTVQRDEETGVSWGFEAVGRIEYRSFSFGGVKGQTISSVCFRKVRRG